MNVGNIQQHDIRLYQFLPSNHEHDKLLSARVPNRYQEKIF